MASMSDVIEQFIKDLVSRSDGVAEIRRNELANIFHCVPSQINYVIATRFNAQHGFLIESKRGGGGYIKIHQIQISKGNHFMHFMQCIGHTLSGRDAGLMIQNLYDYEYITEREAKMLVAAVSDQVLILEQPQRDAVRAEILKNILLSLVE
ncbi:MAG: CtsR family transcriptional regulator [Hyphomonadaceae bacterium]|nr:CtsR family transcriptional regulator [Clostridia bacterium]